MKFLSKIGSLAARIFFKKVTFIDPDGEEVTQTRAREGIKGIGWITGFLVIWHFVIQPVLSYHFPQYHFPALDFSLMGSLILGM